MDGEEGGDDGEEMEEAGAEVTALMQVAAAFMEAHGRPPNLDEVKDTLRKLAAAQQMAPEEAEEAEEAEGEAADLLSKAAPLVQQREVIEIPHE